MVYSLLLDPWSFLLGIVITVPLAYFALAAVAGFVRLKFRQARQSLERVIAESEETLRDLERRRLAVEQEVQEIEKQSLARIAAIEVQYLARVAEVEERAKRLIRSIGGQQ